MLCGILTALVKCCEAPNAMAVAIGDWRRPMFGDRRTSCFIAVAISTIGTRALRGETDRPSPPIWIGGLVMVLFFEGVLQTIRFAARPASG